MNQKVIVIGGGIIGTMTAYHLSKSGCEVELIDQGTVGSGASHGNCGLILPHILPVNMPGALPAATKWLFSHNAPLNIQLGIIARNPGWFLSFLKNCTASTALNTAKTLAHELLNTTLEFDQLISSEQIKCNWQLRGILSIFASARQLDAHLPEVNLERQLGVEVIRLSKSELSSYENALDRAAGAWFYPLAGHLRPDLLINELKSILAENSVCITEHLPFKSFQLSGRTARKAVFRDSERQADTYVLATGAWTSQFQKELGQSIPILPGKGYSCTLSDQQHLISRPCILTEKRVVLTPLQNALRLGGNLEFAGYNSRIHPERISSFLQSANEYLPDQALGTIEEKWFGWRPMTPDGLPFIDFVPSLDNVIVAAGHNMVGVSMAIATGRLVADMIQKGKSSKTPNPFGFERILR